MEPSNTGASLLSTVIMFIFMIIPIAIVCYVLAKEKRGTNLVMWTVLGIIPFVNVFFTLPYLIGTRNALLDAKVDRLLETLEKHP